MIYIANIWQAVLDSGRALVISSTGPAFIGVFVLGLMIDRTHKQPFTAILRAILYAVGAWALTTGLQTLLTRGG
jgi:hypothetical protein